MTNQTNDTNTTMNQNLNAEEGGWLKRRVRQWLGVQEPGVVVKCQTGDVLIFTFDRRIGIPGREAMYQLLENAFPEQKILLFAREACELNRVVSRQGAR